ncbi:MAG: YggS family pyridoxal phosphate-dependent enzyme [bacterium]|nr:YggS family pyridoxal phosphate-dependent enzyme [bacterium]
MGILSNLQSVQQRIAGAAAQAGRSPEQIKLVAVSKTIAAERIIEAIHCGATILGENRVQEAKEKWSSITLHLHECRGELHLIGHLQRNKVKDAVRLFDLIHSVDSIRLAEEIDTRAVAIGKVQRVLVEVNTSGEASKSGVEPSKTGELIETILRLQNIRLEGLMTVGPLFGGSSGARESFQLLRKLRDQFGGEKLLPELSMGMSGDFEIAIAEGANLVRIGSAIFGART